MAFPIAVGLFYPAFGLLLRSEITALSVAGSSLIVAVNAVLLKNAELPGVRRTRAGEDAVRLCNPTRSWSA